jgi:predicted phosphodiesterase
MKIIVFGDIHGRPFWKDIIKKENPDKIIFLGDYVSTHEDYTGEQQFGNLVDILDEKETWKDNMILLRGNHDIQHLGYYWAECSGLFKSVSYEMSTPSFRSEFLSKTKWIHIEEINGENYIFSHAGVSEIWLTHSNIHNVDKINECVPDERFGFTPSHYSDWSGESPTQPCTWIRPQTLLKVAVEEYNQVVGHTPIKTITKFKMNNDKDLWLCDNMENKEYLVIEDNEFKVCKL